MCRAIKTVPSITVPVSPAANAATASSAATKTVTAHILRTTWYPVLPCSQCFIRAEESNAIQTAHTTLRDAQPTAAMVPSTPAKAKPAITAPMVTNSQPVRIPAPKSLAKAPLERSNAQKIAHRSISQAAQNPRCAATKSSILTKTAMEPHSSVEKRTAATGIRAILKAA